MNSIYFGKLEMLYTF